MGLVPHSEVCSYSFRQLMGLEPHCEVIMRLLTGCLTAELGHVVPDVCRGNNDHLADRIFLSLKWARPGRETRLRYRIHHFAE